MDTAGFAHLFRSAVLPQSGLTPAERSNFHSVSGIWFSFLVCNHISYLAVTQPASFGFECLRTEQNRTEQLKKLGNS
jgi:hypothetical protein